MRETHLASRQRFLVCPYCEAGELLHQGDGSARCHLCGGVLGGSMLETLRHIALLPDALGNHACECGHPEMRLLPDGTRHCPACGSEVLPFETSRRPELEGGSVRLSKVER